MPLHEVIGIYLQTLQLLGFLLSSLNGSLLSKVSQTIEGRNEETDISLLFKVLRCFASHISDLKSLPCDCLEVRECHSLKFDFSTVLKSIHRLSLKLFLLKSLAPVGKVHLEHGNAFFLEKEHCTSLLKVFDLVMFHSEKDMME